MGTSDERGASQKRRLETITDVIYALVLWRLFQLIETPDQLSTAGEFREFLAANQRHIVLVVIGLAMTIIYWLQSNMLFSALRRTDGRHTALCIVQLFCLLFFLKSLRFGIEGDPTAITRALESGAAVMVGVAATLSWVYAAKVGKLLSPDISQLEAREIGDRTLVEPLAALVSLPCAFIGPLVWELSWLSLVVFAILLKRRRRRFSNAIGT